MTDRLYSVGSQGSSVDFEVRQRRSAMARFESLLCPSVAGASRIDEVAGLTKASATAPAEPSLCGPDVMQSRLQLCLDFDVPAKVLCLLFVWHHLNSVTIVLPSMCLQLLVLIEDGDVEIRASALRCVVAILCRGANPSNLVRDLLEPGSGAGSERVQLILEALQNLTRSDSADSDVTTLK